MEQKCQCLDVITGKCKWGKTDITYFEEMNFAGFTREEVKALYDEAWQTWARVAHIKPRRIESAAGANVVAREAVLGFALGWSGLPCGVSNDAQLGQKYKSNRRWGMDDLLEVFRHEIGHACGLPHIRGTIMSPSAMGFKELTEGDIKAIQERYGPPNPNPEPDELNKDDFKLFGV